MSDKIIHYVNKDPFDAKEIERLTPDQEKVFLASQKKLMWWKFKRHKIAVVSGIFLALCYLSIFMSEMLAPYSLET
ncbi:MAG: ABC transporter permease, partial [Hyphomicrobiales bacterium]|nr:ABC transporter permease [Hyphomicrobiales bacterium]